MVARRRNIGGVEVVQLKRPGRPYAPRSKAERRKNRRLTGKPGAKERERLRRLKWENERIARSTGAQILPMALRERDRVGDLAKLFRKRDRKPFWKKLPGVRRLFSREERGEELGSYDGRRP